MAIPDLDITENYSAFDLLKDAYLNTAMQDIETHINTNLKLNFTQLALDIFPAGYVFNNDGLQTEVVDLKTSSAILADNETITGSWTFNNAVTFDNTVTSSSTFTSSGQSRCKAYITTVDQTITDSTLTSLDFIGESYDVGDLHDTATNPNRITISSGNTGVYVLGAQVKFDPNATGLRIISIYKNGSILVQNKEFNPDAAEATVLSIFTQDVASLSDYYEVKVYQTSGGGLNVEFGENTTFFTAMKVW